VYQSIITNKKGKKGTLSSYLCLSKLAMSSCVPAVCNPGP